MDQMANMLSFMVFVLIFIAVAVFFTLSQLQWARWLQKNGTPVEAIVMRSERARIIRYYEKLFPRASSMHPIGNSIRAQWTDPQTQRIYTYRRRNNRGSEIKDGDSIQIVVDPRNPRRYRIR